MFKIFSFSALLLFFCALLPVSPAFAGDGAAYSSPLIYPNPTPGGKFVLQGVCARHGIEASNPQIDMTRSTWACNGASDKMLRIFYRGGPNECVYIDNFNNDGDVIKAFFVPLATSEEWLAFKQNLPGGMRLRFGCPGVIQKDPCGNEFALPDAPASDDEGDAIRITTGGDYAATYSCFYTLPPETGEADAATTTKVLDHGCGEWKKTKETGSCL